MAHSAVLAGCTFGASADSAYVTHLSTECVTACEHNAARAFLITARFFAYMRIAYMAIAVLRQWLIAFAIQTLYREPRILLLPGICNVN